MGKLTATAVTGKKAAGRYGDGYEVHLANRAGAGLVVQFAFFAIHLALVFDGCAGGDGGGFIFGVVAFAGGKEQACEQEHAEKESGFHLRIIDLNF